MAERPIIKVEPANRFGARTGVTYTDVPDPSSYRWNKMDNSDQQAGRNIATDMIKLRVSKSRTLELTWLNRPYSEISKALKIFDHEYGYLTYLDALEGTYVTKHFYFGDMSADLYSTNLEIWGSTSVTCIQAITDKT